MFRCSCTIIRERIDSCVLKLQLLKLSIKIHRFVVNVVVVWLHIYARINELPDIGVTAPKHVGDVLV